jgi:hypothetical protein
METSISGEKVFVTPIECTMCREIKCKSNFICAVFSKDKETNKVLCGKGLNYFCPDCYQVILNRLGLKQ